MLNQKDLPFKEKILLNLNKNSNNFNTDWALGVKFTFFSSLLFFTILLFVNTFITNSGYPLILNYKNNFADGNYILNQFLKFIFNIGFKDTEIQSNGYLYFIFIFSKLFIGYGFYQTIQAFRKYGK